MKKLRIWIFVGLAILLISAQFVMRSFWPESQIMDGTFKYEFPYNLSKPNQKIKLPAKLSEISGLCYYEGEKVLGLQDEKGDIFVIDIAKGKVEDNIKYAKSGDFEGIAHAKKKIYTLRSDGDVYRVKGFSEEDQKTKKYETDLETENDTEGLCYDPTQHRLLIACKGKPKNKKDKGKRVIYAFDIGDKELSKKPVLSVDLKQIRELLNNPKAEFAPSGIAVHPISGDIYVIATVGKLLVVLSPENEIKYIHQLDPDVFKQPEGITFFPNGDLIISNEAHFKGSNSNLLRFSTGK